MRNRVFVYLAVFVMMLFVGGTNSFAADMKSKNEIIYTELSPQGNNGVYGSAAAKVDTDLTLQEILTYAIEDEYIARASYALVIEKFGEQTPFIDIVKAEGIHINAVKLLFPKYDFPVPADNSKNYIKAPASIKESLEMAKQIEIDNVAMYEKFLKQDIPNDVREIFLGLKSASQEHLKAFQNALKLQ
ncbi:DUF2202 domain-containing protein [Clostridium sp.]|uniref:ferritin-like domain-containing protein n=1 Tax=Clostridium sp. TaxID=1506 RepID=UPI002FC63C33